MKPKVTIGICARSCQNTISAAIESAITQDFDHRLMEIIMVDDGSEDKTLQIMREYASKTDISTKIFTGKWRGIGAARATVLNNALGDYIVWLDADEMLESSFVRKQVMLMEKNPNAGIGLAKIGFLPSAHIVLVLELLHAAIEFSYCDFNASNKLPGTGGAIYRVSATKEVGGFNQNLLSLGEDIEIASRMKDAGWLIVKGDATFYEKHGGLQSWRELWQRYVNRGINSRILYMKNRKLFSLYKINPLASLTISLFLTAKGYRLLRSKIVLLLPAHFTFKMIGWFYGFSKTKRSKCH